MSADTALALALVSGSCGLLIGTMAGALLAWMICSVSIRHLNATNHELRRQVLALGGTIPRRGSNPPAPGRKPQPPQSPPAPGKPQRTGGRQLPRDL